MCIQLKEQIKNHSPEAVEAQKAEVAQWESEVKDLRALMPVFTTKERIRTVELPALERQIKALDEDLPSNSEKAEQARYPCNFLKLEISLVCRLLRGSLISRRILKTLLP